jgi:hypothetical protein
MSGSCGEILNTKYWSKNLQGKDQLEDSGVDGKIL